MAEVVEVTEVVEVAEVELAEVAKDKADGTRLEALATLAHPMEKNFAHANVSKTQLLHVYSSTHKACAGLSVKSRLGK